MFDTPELTRGIGLLGIRPLLLIIFFGVFPVILGYFVMKAAVSRAIKDNLAELKTMMASIEEKKKHE